MRRYASFCRQNPFCRNHAAQVFRRCFIAHEQHFFTLFGRGGRAVGIQINFTGSSARPGRKSASNGLRFLYFRDVENRRE